MENLLYLFRRLQRHPNDLAVDLLYTTIEASMDNTGAQPSLTTQPPNSILQ